MRDADMVPNRDPEDGDGEGAEGESGGGDDDDPVNQCSCKEMNIFKDIRVFGLLFALQLRRICPGDVCIDHHAWGIGCMRCRLVATAATTADDDGYRAVCFFRFLSSFQSV